LVSNPASLAASTSRSNTTRSSPHSESFLRKRHKTVESKPSSSTLTGIENLVGSSKNDTLTGSDGNNNTNGRGEADSLTGMGGVDTLFGAGGPDSVNSQDGVNGNDSLNGGAGTDTKTTDTTEKSIVGFP
jgi:hypothetical protein